MTIKLKQIVNSSFGIKLAALLGSGLPPKLGYCVADYLAARIASQRNSQLVRAIRANQWVVRGEPRDGSILDRAVSDTLRHSARSMYDLYHYIHDTEATRRLIILDPAVQQLTRRPELDERGLMIVGLHLSNFDLVLQWMCLQGMKLFALTIPDPQGSQRMEFEMRKRTGMNLVPVSFKAIRQALCHLQRGGMVVTGIDRPTPSPKASPCFFGRPSGLPIHHVYLAIKAKVPIVIIVVNSQADGKYRVLASDLIEMDPIPNREQEILQNAEKVLRIAEDFIRQSPSQWSVTLPVWPETLELVPD